MEATMFPFFPGISQILPSTQPWVSSVRALRPPRMPITAYRTLIQGGPSNLPMLGVFPVDIVCNFSD